MGKVGRFIWSVRDDTDKAGVGQTFDAAKGYVLSLNSGAQPSGQLAGGAWRGRIESVVVNIKAIAGGATKLTLKGAMPGASGNVIILPDTEATIALGVGSTTVGAVAYQAGLDWVNNNDDLVLVFKTDAGTVTLDSVQVCWAE
tara:strand:- start:14724 stop:15152 length:429 start_codon:yes stop_codon:yes gene_type:complete